MPLPSDMALSCCEELDQICVARTAPAPLLHHPVGEATAAAWVRCATAYINALYELNAHDLMHMGLKLNCNRHESDQNDPSCHSFRGSVLASPYVLLTYSYNQKPSAIATSIVPHLPNRRSKVFAIALCKT